MRNRPMNPDRLFNPSMYHKQLQATSAKNTGKRFRKATDFADIIAHSLSRFRDQREVEV